ncbi:hypothetical protein K437DRAFT_247305 [Tilletiaria anomala UBC 951]|uniref:DUF7704 domain-containing protein n=1 Tax=Tilletiaria anomala (strain ATCC 24038 / CBS 436.72 / UBC 951) TaxID=1037660 RepID=A0A066VY89_TILAU|nr:uncharacterized protein K437DRAFT_247305 [Tilletiaria anomala UBC 951]KDN45253.1 hypothetical protein K437DRAFT_247305 [Tilletiaria anomala UBC 951]
MSASPSKMTSVTPLPRHWYLFFGVIEPISVFAGCIYAIFFQEKFYLEQVPEAFAPPPYTRSIFGTPSVKLDAAVRMVLAQLGSCYFLIMLNSALVFYALRRFVKDPVALENILYYLVFVLGAADWSHIGLTLYILPSPTPRLSNRAPNGMDKLALLLKPSSWNSLLFGNVMVPFILVCFRAAWWTGVGRDSGATLRTKSKTK